MRDILRTTPRPHRHRLADVRVQPSKLATPRAARARDRNEGLFHASIVLGRVAGIQIGLNWSWFLVFGLVSWSLGAEVFPAENPGLSDGTYTVMAIAAAVLFFGSLLLHELGHAVIALREGMQIEGITLWVFGGVAKFKGMFPSARAELRIALAGPAVSLLIGVTLTALAALLALPAAVDGVAAWLGRINLILLVFNMLPALPLDGGRVLRASIWQATGDFTRATRFAGRLGRGAGQAMIGGGLALLLLVGSPGGLWLALIGWFLAKAAASEASLATLREAFGGLRVTDAMVSSPQTVPADLTLDAFARDLFWGSRHAAYPVMSNGSAVGILPFKAVAQVPAAERAVLRAGEAAVPLDEALILHPGDNLADAAVELATSGLGRALVLDGEELVGLLSITDISRLLELQPR